MGAKWMLPLAGTVACAFFWLASCGGSDGTADAGDGGGDTGLVYAEGGTSYCGDPDGGCPMFPPMGTPECDPKTLGPAQLVYPSDGLLLPPNMNVLEVQFVPPQGATLFEVDFLNLATNVAVVTPCTPVPDVRGGPSRGCGVTLPQAAWNDIANKNRDGDDVVVVVRATANGQCVTSSKESIRIKFAKDDLAGAIYYWQSAVYGGIGGKTGGIYRHDFGTFDPKPDPFLTSGATGKCIGCHTLSRDGHRMSYELDDPDGDDEFGDVKTQPILDVAGRLPVGGANNVSPGFQTFTHDHGKMIASSFKQGKNARFDVYDGNNNAFLASMTLPQGMLGTHPDLSRDDSQLVFVRPAPMTISAEGDLHFFGGSLYTATFNAQNNTMGTPSPLLTAQGMDNFYYPAWSFGGDWVVFNHAADTSPANCLNDAFYNRKARVKMMHFPPQQGDVPIDLPALNVADGLSNSWPRWSPFPQTYKGHKLLWVTFSSNRDYGLHLANKGFDNCYPPEGPAYNQPQPLSKQNTTYENCAQPQIWMAAINVDPDRSQDSKDRSYPAFWLPFQDVNSHNHSAQWVEKIVPPTMMGCGDAGACGPSELCCNGTCLPSCAN